VGRRYLQVMHMGVSASDVAFALRDVLGSDVDADVYLQRMAQQLCIRIDFVRRALAAEASTTTPRTTR
jgi:hypothetical protein